MSELYIDSASIYEIIGLLRCKQPDETYGWAWRSAIEATSTLIHSHHVIMSPAPHVHGAASGPYGYLMQEISDLIELEKPDPQKAIKAISNTKKWARKNPEEVLNAYETIKTDKNNFSNWLQGGISFSWTEHSNRLGGLFDFQFIPEISRILDVPTDELEKVWNLSKNKKVLEDCSKNITDENNFSIMKDAYVVSALLRGRYHDYLARDSSLQIIHHPIRLPILPSSKGKTRIEFPVSNVESYLSHIILASTFAEKSLNNKIKCWEENMRRVRKEALRGSIDLRQKDYDDVAYELALKAAEQSNIRIHSKLFTDALDATVALGVGVFTSFFLVGWSSFIVGGIAYAASKKTEIGENAARLLGGRQNRLRDLANFEPGRIESTWKK